MRFDAVLKLVVDRAELQIVLEILERGLDELDIDDLAAMWGFAAAKSQQACSGRHAREAQSSASA